LPKEPCERAFGKDERGREMMKNKVMLFEIPASNFKKAKEFYEKVFDWKVIMGRRGSMAESGVLM
jgi:predicted enzyme related to lactoylglutathione lyase